MQAESVLQAGFRINVGLPPAQGGKGRLFSGERAVVTAIDPNGSRFGVSIPTLFVTRSDYLDSCRGTNRNASSKRLMAPQGEPPTLVTRLFDTAFTSGCSPLGALAAPAASRATAATIF